MPIPVHYRKDSPNGITPPNPDSDVDLIAHITKHRGMKTPFTSVSERAQCLKNFSGDLYSTEPDVIVGGGHRFQSHPEVIDEIRAAIHELRRGERVLAQRAFQYAERAREAVVIWQFHLDGVERKDRISWCATHIQQYFQRV